MAPRTELVPSAGRWLKRWQEIQDAVSYVQQRGLGAFLVEGDSWRVQAGSGGDVHITLFGSAHMEVHASDGS